MRKLALIGAVLLLALAGCSTGATVPEVDMEAVYLSAWHEKFPASDDAAAVKVGKDICVALEGGDSFAEQVTYLMSLASMSGADAGYMIGAATSAFCPEHSS